MKSPAAFAISAVAVLVAATNASANTLNPTEPTGAPPLLDPQPGSGFPVYEIMATGQEAYAWSEDIAGLSVGDTLLEIRINAFFSTTRIPVFQAFGNCDGRSDPFGPLFNLSIDGAAADWTSTSPPAPGPCFYHDLVDLELEMGEHILSVSFAGIAEGAPDSGPNGTLIDMRFGNVILALPGPPSIFALLTAIAGLMGWRQIRSRSG
ncbi:MAG: hypothetical protein AAF322_09590 [Pseudomonadota bacterium]